MMINICPKCGSTNLIQNTDIFLGSGAMLSQYCADCNFGYPSGGFFPEIDEKSINEFRKDLKSKN